MILFEKVTIKKGENVVLEDIDFELKEDQNLCITGDNGSGKSTLLDAIAGKIFPHKGKISKPSYREIVLVPRDYSFHRILGSAFQYYQQRYQAYDSEVGPNVWEVFQNQVKPVGTVDEASVELPELSYPEERINEVAELMNISHLLDRKVTSLSNGETRRSLIAYSLLQNPKLLLLDNPTTGLDTASKEMLKSILSSLKNQFVLVSALNEWPDSLHRLLVLQNGKIENIYKHPFPALEVTNKVLDLSKSFLEKWKGNVEDTFESVVKITNGWVKYGDKKVLDSVNWEVKRGEKWALLGPNGSGKTSLLSLISADNPQAYQNDLWLFDKKRGSGESIWDIKKKIGFVSPELHIYFPKNSTVFKVVGSGLFDTIGLFKKLTEELEGRVHELIEAFKLTHLSDRRLNEISSGEQRLVLLARALIKNPPLLILDEACQGLDYQHLVYFRELINQLVTKLDKTLIYVTHNQEELPDCIDKFLRLDQGRVI
ncbi:MAG: ATP-binding cassette domain-containing protein [Cytophagales bacterium]|nr:ATP-binding cassette domain-containing protein [Cytophagales bacterium]